MRATWWRRVIVVLCSIAIMAAPLFIARLNGMGVEAGLELTRLVLGAVMIASGLFMPQMRRWLGTRESGSQFTVPRFRRAARVEDVAMRAFFVLFGIENLFSGVASYFHAFSATAEFVVRMVLLGMALLAILVSLVSRGARSRKWPSL